MLASYELDNSLSREALILKQLSDMKGFDVTGKDWNLWVEKYVLPNMRKLYTCTRMKSSRRGHV